MFNLIYVSGLILLGIIIISLALYLVYKIFVDERIRHRYEQLLSKSYDDNDKLREREFNLLDTVKINNEKYLIESTNDKKIISKLINDLAFFEEVDKRAIMSDKEQKKIKTRIKKNVTDGKELIEK